MVARVAISTTGQGGQYIGTTKVPTPSASPGSSTCRNFNGFSDRLILGPSNSLGPTYLVVMSFWRNEVSEASDLLVAGRLFTQYCVGGSRVAVGVDRGLLAVNCTDVDGVNRTVRSEVKVADLSRHFLGISVAFDRIQVFLDGRLAVEVEVSLKPADLARVVIGADSDRRFFNGRIDDLAMYKTPPADQANWLRYYRSLVLNQAPRDYIAAGLVSFNGAQLIGGYAAGGTQGASRVALATPFRAETELAVQSVEFKFTGQTAASRIGVVNQSHDLQTLDLGQGPDSYAYLPDGNLLYGSEVIDSGLGVWKAGEVMALVWVAASRSISLWRQGEVVHSMTLPLGTWTPAATVGLGALQVNSGQSYPQTLAVDAPGLPILVWSRMATEFKSLKLGELCSPLTEVGLDLKDLATGAVKGAYTAPALDVRFTPDSFDGSRRVGGGIKINSGTHTTADDDFFFAVGLCPEAADLLGERVIFDSPGKWSLKLLDGRLLASVGAVQVGSLGVALEAGKRYLLGVTRSTAGKLMVWSQIGYLLQSSDQIQPQTSGDVWLGSKEDGTSAFTGRLAHLVMSSTLPAPWKLARFRACYSWDTPDIAGMTPNPAYTRQAMEVCWRDLVAYGVSASPPPTACYGGMMAVAPDEVGVGYRLVGSKGVDAYAGDYIGPWSPHGILTQPVTRLGTQLLLEQTTLLETVAIGSAGVVNGEIFRVEAIDQLNKIVTVSRGCADTVPAEQHGAGSAVWFYGATLAVVTQPYAVNDTLKLKVLTRSALAEMGEEFAPVDTLLMAGRAARPYPPGLVKVNGEVEPLSLKGTVEVTWKHRNKVAQGVALSAWGEGNFTSPVGLTYVVRAYAADTGTLLHESTPIAGTDSNYNLYTIYTGPLRVTVTSYQGGLACLQAPSVTFDYSSKVLVLLMSEEDEALALENFPGSNLAVEVVTAMRAASYSGDLPDDWDGMADEEEEEEEEVTGVAYSGSIMGVKISELPENIIPLTGAELVPIVRNGTNYWTDMQDLLAYIVASIPGAADGKNAYQVALDNGFIGTESAWLDSLRGPIGLSSNASRRILNVSSAAGAFICNWALYDEIRLRLVGPVTLTFQGAKDGQGCMLKIQQDAVGGRAVTLPLSVRYNNLVQSYSAIPNPGLVDKVGFVYDDGDSSYDFVTYIPGISF